MVAEPARDLIPEWDGQANALERFEEDVSDLHSRRAEGTQSHTWFEALATVSKWFSTESDWL